MNDRLAQIEADCLARLADDAAPEAFKKGTRDVLALVEIAKAARNTGWRDSTGLCWCEQSQELTGKPHRPQCARLRAALSALDGEEGKA